MMPSESFGVPARCQMPIMAFLVVPSLAAMSLADRVPLRAIALAIKDFRSSLMVFICNITPKLVHVAKPFALQGQGIVDKRLSYAEIVCNILRVAAILPLPYGA